MIRITYRSAIASCATLAGLFFVDASHMVLAQGDASRGKVVYERNCQGCHGKTGAGVGGATPNLTDANRMSGLSDQDLFDIVTKGRPGTGMPSWSAILSEQDRWNVVRYVRSLIRK